MSSTENDCDNKWKNVENIQHAQTMKIKYTEADNDYFPPTKIQIKLVDSWVIKLWKQKLKKKNKYKSVSIEYWVLTWVPSLSCNNNKIDTKWQEILIVVALYFIDSKCTIELKVYNSCNSRS